MIYANTAAPKARRFRGPDQRAGANEIASKHVLIYDPTGDFGPGARFSCVELWNGRSVRRCWPVGAIFLADGQPKIVRIRESGYALETLNVTIGEVAKTNIPAARRILRIVLESL